MSFASAQQAAARTACRQAFAAPRLARRLACTGRSTGVGRAAEAASAGGSPARRGVLSLLAGSAAAGMLGGRSVAAAAASVDQAEQVSGGHAYRRAQVLPLEQRSSSHRH